MHEDGCLPGRSPVQCCIVTRPGRHDTNIGVCVLLQDGRFIAAYTALESYRDQTSVQSSSERICCSAGKLTHNFRSATVIHSPHGPTVCILYWSLEKTYFHL